MYNNNDPAPTKKQTNKKKTENMLQYNKHKQQDYNNRCLSINEGESNRAGVYGVKALSQEHRR